MPGSACPPDCPSRNAINYLVFFQHAGFFKVAEAIPHPKFQFPTTPSGSQVVSGDAAVIRLSEPVNGIPAAPFATCTLPKGNATVALVGFGQSYETNSQGAGIVQATTDRGLKGAVHLYGTTQPYQLTVVGPKGQQVCTSFGGNSSIPGEASCSISSPQGGTHTISAAGAPQQKVQPVAGGSKAVRWYWDDVAYAQLRPLQAFEFVRTGWANGVGFRFFSTYHEVNASSCQRPRTLFC